MRNKIFSQYLATLTVQFHDASRYHSRLDKCYMRSEENTCLNKQAPVQDGQSYIWESTRAVASVFSTLLQ